MGNTYQSGISYNSAGSGQYITRSPRTILLGDSQLSLNFNATVVPTTALTFTVTNGVATIINASSGITTGARFQLYTKGDRTWALDPMNNAYLVCATSAASQNPITFNTTAPNGDYSAGYNGTGWTLINLDTTLDFGIYQWLSALLKNPWRMIFNYSIVGMYTSDIIAQLPKVFAGPTFDEVVLSVGSAYIETASSSTQAQAFSTTEYNNLVNTIIPRLLATGARITILNTPALPSGFTNYFSMAVSNFARALKRWCRKYPSQILYVDMLAQWLDGTTGYAISGYNGGTSDPHPTSSAAITIARTLAASAFSEWFPPDIDVEPKSIFEDASTYSQPGALYPQVVPHGMMDGTASVSTGTLPTGWTVVGTPAGTVVTAGQTARTAQGSGNNSGKWGYCTDIQMSGTAPTLSILSPGFSSLIQNGTWYEATATLTAVADTTGLVNVDMSEQIGAAGGANQGAMIKQGTYNNGWPLKAGDAIYLLIRWQTVPVGSITAGNVRFDFTCTGTASVHLQLSNVSVQQIDPPTQ